MSIQTHADVKAAKTSELVSIYNTITKKNINRFKDRKTAEARTWAVLQENAPKLAVVEKAPTAKVKTKAPGKRDNYDNRIIQLLVKENPKRTGSRAHKKFEILMEHEGKTLAEYKAREGKFSSLDMEKGWPATEIRWSLSLGLIKLVNA